MSIEIGDRVSSIKNNNIGTVRSRVFDEDGGLLLGVEWDVNNKMEELKVGNNGKYRYNEHFETGDGEVGKIRFVHLNQVNLGISFQEAIRDRYLTEEENVEYFVGMKKAHEYCRRLSSLSLEGMCISSCICKKLLEKKSEFNINELSMCYKNINSLYLNDNLISDWEVLYCILNHLPKLEYLILNGNRIERNVSCNQYKFNNIKVLSLSKTYIQFEEILSLCKQESVFSNVEYINVSSNNYSILNLNYKNHSIKKLDLSFNTLCKWENIRMNILENIIELTSLNISNNNLLNIPLNNVNSINNYEYPNLTELIIDNCNIQNLGSIVYLSKIFPNLQRLSLRNNKIINEKEEFNLKSIIISLIPNIRIYNKSIVTKEDVVSSQRYYISQYSVHMNSKLREIDPNGDILYEFVLKNDSIKSENEHSDSENRSEEKYIDINFIPQCEFSKKLLPTRIKINKKMAICDIKLLIWKLYKIPKNEPLEYIFVSNNSKVNIDNYNDSYSLADLGIETNGDIYIQDILKIK